MSLSKFGLASFVDMTMVTVIRLEMVGYLCWCRLTSLEKAVDGGCLGEGDGLCAK